VTDGYEINLGKKMQGSGVVTWNLTLENQVTLETERTSKVAPLDYKVYTVKEDDGQWLSLSRHRGVLETPG
jgi:hypothetical protein